MPLKKDSDTIRSILGLDEGEKIDKIMITDDARQYLNIALYHALCWIHEIRLYENEKEILGNEFDMLFSTETGYEERDKRIALTKEKKEELLLVLWFPEIYL